jgi:hypothetical protein
MTADDYSNRDAYRWHLSGRVSCKPILHDMRYESGKSFP